MASPPRPQLSGSAWHGPSGRLAVPAALLLVVYAVVAPVLFAMRDLPFDSDEAVHAANGLAVTFHLREGRLGQALAEVYRQRWYPPGLSLYLTPFILVFGPQYWAVRYPLLLALLVGLSLLYRAGRALWPGDRAAALGAMALAATVPLLWMQAALCMEESLGLVGLAATFLAYARLVRKGRGWLWVGVAAATTFLLRITAGLFVLIALAWAMLAYRQHWHERIVILKGLGPGLLTAVGWWAGPDKLAGLRDYFLASAPQATDYSFHTVAVWAEHMLRADTVGVLTGVILLAGLALALARWREPRAGFLLALVLVVWGALALKRQDVSRFFYSALPPAYLLAAERSAAVWRWLRRRVAARSDRAARWAGWAAAALGLAYLLAALAVRVRTFPLLMAVTYETGPELTQAARWVADQTQPDESAVLLVNGWDQFSAQMLEWAIGAARWPAANPTPVQVLEETLRDPAECQACAGQFAEVALQQPGMRLVHFENAPVPAAGAWWAYAVALAPVWDGQWQTSADFELRLWDGLLQERILAHPLAFVDATADEVALTQRYTLALRINTVRLGNQAPANE